MRAFELARAENVKANSSYGCFPFSVSEGNLAPLQILQSIFFFEISLAKNFAGQ
jgi:hypothetical protein